MMYFWNIKSLREELIDNSLSEKNQMMYLMLTMVLYAFSGQLTNSDYDGGYFLAETITVLAATVLGILYCYDGNKAGDGKEFIKRFTCVSWVVTLRIIVVIGIVGFIVGFLLYFFDDSTEIESGKDEFLGIMLLLAFEVIYFGLINRHLKYISTKSQEL